MTYFSRLYVYKGLFTYYILTVKTINKVKNQTNYHILNSIIASFHFFAFN